MFFCVMVMEERLKNFMIEEDETDDPSLIENILARLEEIQSEDENFMEILLSKQNEMVVTWEQPWYQKSNCITRPLKLPSCEDLQNNDITPFRTNTICHDESKIIHKNWKKFRKMFDVPNTPICLARWRNTNKSRSPTTPEETVRRFVIAFLAQGLERNLYQVYKHFVIKYGVLNSGRYSEMEEKIMEACVNYCPKNAVPYLSAVLSREPRGILKRLWQLYNGRQEKKRMKWTLPLATKLLNLLMQYTGETQVENLKLRRFEKKIWLQIEHEMDHFYIYLQNFWHNVLHVQLFVKGDVKIKKIRRKAFNIIKSYPYKVWKDIRWKEVAKHFPDGFNHGFLYNICRYVVHKLPGYHQYQLQEVISNAIVKTKSMRNRRLRTLVLNKNQELEIIKYDNKLKL